MAKIQTTISLRDNMSNVINNITSNINKMSAAANRASSQVNSMSNGFNRTNQSVNRTTNSVQFFGMALRRAAVVALIKELAEAFIKTSDAISMAESKLRLLEGSSAAAVASMDQIYLAAQRSRAEYTNFAAAVGKLGTLAGKSFGDTNEIIGFVELMNKLYTVSGSSAQEMKASMYQLTQALSSGRLNGDELRSIMENAPMLAQAIAKNLGVSVGQMKKLASEGAVTTKVVKDSLYAIQNDLNEAFEKTPMTFEAAMRKVKNSIIKAFEPAMREFNNLINNPAFQQFAQDVGKVLSFVGKALALVFKGIGAVATVAMNAWNKFKPVIIGVLWILGTYITALAAAKVASLALAAAQAVLTLGKSLYTAATLLAAVAVNGLSMATMKATMAQMGYNATLLASPVFWIVGAILLLIGVIYAAVAAFNHFTGSTVSGTGVILGSVMWLVGYVVNSLFMLWNHLVSFAEFFANFLTNPVYSVKKLFVGLAKNVLDTIIAMTRGIDTFATNFANSIISAINAVIGAWNAFLDILPSEVKSVLGLSKGSEFSARTSITSDLEGIKNSLDDWLGEAPENYNSFDKYKATPLDLTNMYNKGYQWGENVDGFFKNMTTSPADLFENMGGQFDPLDPNGKLGDIGKNTGKTAKNTQKLADYGEEDLKYLRELATQQAINRFTTAKISLNMSNNNNISSNMDLDGVVSYLTAKTQEALASAAAKAY